MQLPDLAPGDSVLNAVIRPGSLDGYITAGGRDSAWLYHFRALALEQVPFSHR